MTQNCTNIPQNKKNLLVVAGGTLNEKSIAANQNKLLQILTNVFEDIYYITFCERKNIGLLNQGDLLDIDNISTLKLFNSSILNFFYGQIAVTKNILMHSIKHDFDIILFTMGQDLQLFPVLISKLLGKKVIIRSSGRPTFVIKKNLMSKAVLKTTIFKIIEEINYNLANTILTECEYAIIENDFDKYDKVYVASLFVDLNTFKEEIPTKLRPYDIGYIGGFSEAKGILNFIESIPLFLEKNPNLRIFIAGNGRLKEEVTTRIKNMNLPNITFSEWIPHEDLPNYLNDIKLLVVPSLKEGLPNMIVEGIACGTVILATPVGAIPALIIDEKTGFIMNNNSPSCIAENVTRVLDHLNLESIVNNAKKPVEREFAYEAVVQKYKTIFYNI